ncbi:MAG: dihydroorotase family protein, partial [Candidatus Diapherotrites archaeon]|nr:dihydroorotase family protein [Candidatus Diapherotrites archaeon]
MAFDLVLKNALICQKGHFLKRNIGIRNTEIAEVSESEMLGSHTIDCKQNFLIPGLIDSHVHFRYPGMAHKEDWGHATKAALAGGVTTVLDMPNTIPALTNRELLQEKKGIVKKEARCNFGFHFGATTDNSGELRRVEGIASIKVFMGSSTGSLLINDDSKLEEIFRIAKEREIIVTVHAEDENTIRASIERAKREGKDSAKAHNDARPPIAERIAVEKALELQKKIGNSIHFLHVSTEDAIELIAEAKKQRQGISCEVTPHHLFLCEDDLEKLGNFGKMNPPLRSAQDRKALWKAIGNNVVDTIGTDHAPHLQEEKKVAYWDAPSGVPGIETMLPLLLNAAAEERITLTKIIELCSTNPARIFKIPNKGQVREGFDADLALVSLEGGTTIKNEDLKTKCKWSPFN